MMTRAYLFPGQGSQEPGMGQDLYQTHPEARAIMDQAESLVPGLLEACFSDDDTVLNQTEIVQPAIVTVSAALWELLPQDLREGYVTGHSLGEYSALYAAGFLSFADTLRLVKERARLMGEAAREVSGGMMAVMGVEYAELVRLIQEWDLTEEVFPANRNSAQQTVISGTEKGLEFFGGKAKEKGLKAVRLKVTGPFHSPLMEPVAEAFRSSLSEFTFQEPALPLVSATTAQVVKDPAELKEILVKQFTSPVLWTDTVSWLVQSGVQTVVEVGPGKVLTGLIRRIDRSLGRVNIQTAADIAAWAEKNG
ncbi:MAG: ACP S-malonyltransferase [Firmicutes bacterium]|nr:ACP S-malonyltransferase [Bacillota bacterium]